MTVPVVGVDDVAVVAVERAVEVQDTACEFRNQHMLKTVRYRFHESRTRKPSFSRRFLSRIAEFGKNEGESTENHLLLEDW